MLYGVKRLGRIGSGRGLAVFRLWFLSFKHDYNGKDKEQDYLKTPYKVSALI